MKIHKKPAIAVVLALVILFIIGSCAAANASGSRNRQCVTKREWKTMMWNATPIANAHHFGTRGFVWDLKTHVENSSPTDPTPDPNNNWTLQTMTVKYDKCGPDGRISYSSPGHRHWGKHQFVKVIYVGWWPNIMTSFNGFNTLDQLHVGYARS